MMNLFSIFDPLTFNYFSLNWFSSFFIFMIIPNLYWYIPSRLNFMILKIFNLMCMEFKILLNLKINLFNMILLLSLFYFILFNNFMGMFPYIFTSSSHLSFSLSISLSMWISLMIYGWFFNMNKMFIHLVPQGTPYILMSFMVLIETISNLIRPGTLAVRLTANMIAGHLLMTLISSTGSSLSFFPLTIMLLMQSLLLILELSVSIIQSYVFTVLSALYMVESS